MIIGYFANECRTTLGIYEALKNEFFLWCVRKLPCQNLIYVVLLEGT